MEKLKVDCISVFTEYARILFQKIMLAHASEDSEEEIQAKERIQSWVSVDGFASIFFDCFSTCCSDCEFVVDVAEKPVEETGSYGKFGVEREVHRRCDCEFMITNARIYNCLLLCTDERPDSQMGRMTA